MADKVDLLISDLCDKWPDPPTVKNEPPTVDQPSSKTRFRFVHIADLRLKPPEFLIKPWLEKDTLSLSFGDPGCGKSFFAIDIAASVATGSDFHGMTVNQGPVIYIAGEGQNGIGRRFMAWSIVHGADLKTAPLYLSTVPLGLCDADQMQAAMDAVEEIAQIAGPSLLIVIDTVARNFGPGDENSTADMGRFIAAADQIRSLYHSAVHLVHHTGHGDKKRARGSMALKGAIDAEYRLDKDQDAIVRVKATKMKDAGLPEPMAFEIRGVDLPLKDADGDTVNSAVLHRVEYTQPAATTRKTGHALGINQRKALEILERLYVAERKSLMRQGIRPETARVSIERWGSKCKEAGMNRQTVHRIKASLESGGLIEIEDSHVIPL
ncbi:AAA family ATPase [Desulfosarcina widdelii]|uniref:AAA family ATPase n=1 Tax=Desulfosarcina widdelii TaxID=947919 RepID=UPI001478A260|nr:AAA family ATPase [Desulfosarcina widdelii]